MEPSDLSDAIALVQYLMAGLVARGVYQYFRPSQSEEFSKVLALAIIWSIPVSAILTLVGSTLPSAPSSQLASLTVLLGSATIGLLAVLLTKGVAKVQPLAKWRDQADGAVRIHGYSILEELQECPEKTGVFVVTADDGVFYGGIIKFDTGEDRTVSGLVLNAPHYRENSCWTKLTYSRLFLPWTSIKRIYLKFPSQSDQIQEVAKRSTAVRADEKSDDAKS